jgi:hypothetical protein
MNFNSDTNPPTIRETRNFSSITDKGSGRFDLNFATAMNNANYTLLYTGADTATGVTVLRALYGQYTTYADVGIGGTSALGDRTWNSFAVFSG